MLRSAYYFDAHDDINVVEMMSVEPYVGQYTHCIKRGGIWPVVIYYEGQELARLEQPGDSVRLLAVMSHWIVLDIIVAH